jgi:hypothetical protein
MTTSFCFLENCESEIFVYNEYNFCNRPTVFLKMGFGNSNALPHLHACVVMDDRIIYLTGVNSTRLFLARPSLVSLPAAGFVIPKPFVVSRSGSIP